MKKKLTEDTSATSKLQTNQYVRVSQEAAKEILWRRGELSWKLHPTQKRMYDQFKSSEKRRFVINCSRRLGKSYLLCVLALEQAIKQPNSRICYAAPTKAMVREIIKPLIRKIIADCPTDLRPKWVTNEQKYLFPNGSVLVTAGVEAGHDEDLRGSEAHLSLVDEAGFMSDLDYLVKDILMPQMLTTGGKMLMASTPPRTAHHAFEGFYKEAYIKGCAAKYTIYDNPLLTQEILDEYMADAGGENSTTWRREYLAEFIVDEQLVVLPEFDESKHVGEWEAPKHMDWYAAMDLGFRDLTFVIWGYWDFLKNKLVIEQELVIERVRTDTLAQGIKDIENAAHKPFKPFLRVSDVDLIVLNDLDQLHGLKFVPTDKDDKEAQINHLRLLLQKNQIVINPRCRQLIAHCKMAAWDTARKTFIRTPGYGHFDGVDALVYLVRNVRFGKNPYPIEYYETPYLTKKPLSLNSSRSMFAIQSAVNGRNLYKK